MKSWLENVEQSDFNLSSLPYGVFHRADESPTTARIGVAIGEFVIDLAAYCAAAPAEFAKELHGVFGQSSMNDFVRVDKAIRLKLRELLIAQLTNPAGSLASHREQILIPLNKITLCLPVKVGDFCAFYSSEFHATNLGKIARPTGDPLFPNWKYLPVAYSSKSGGVVPDNFAVVRPSGQLRSPADTEPTYAKSKKLDFELELGFIIGKDTEHGQTLSVEQAKEYVFGVTIVNDWSARDIQFWEYQPLGPFLGKNFATAMGGWVLPIEALESCRVDGPEQSPEPLPHLRQKQPRGYDIQLGVTISLKDGASVTASSTNFRHMYWSVEQQIAHLTSNGSPIKVGDVVSSGTISGPTDDSLGSMIEMSWNGTRPVQFPNGQTRSFVEDGDTLRFTAVAKTGDRTIGLGSLTGKVAG
jgi:fumarylacetoacetase